jgi:hypothetical protein
MSALHPFTETEQQAAWDRQDRIDERHVEEATHALYDLLTEQVGERMAEAVTSGFTYTAAQLRIVLDDARKHADKWAVEHKEDSKYV